MGRKNVHRWAGLYLWNITEMGFGQFCCFFLFLVFIRAHNEAIDDESVTAKPFRLIIRWGFVWEVKLIICTL